MADEVRRFINGEIDEEGNQLTTVNADGKTVLISDPSRAPPGCRAIHLTPDTKRLYPFGSLAGNVLGFVNANEVGAYGLEAAYDDVLQGSTGLTITATDVNGTAAAVRQRAVFRRGERQRPGADAGHQCPVLSGKGPGEHAG